MNHIPHRTGHISPYVLRFIFLIAFIAWQHPAWTPTIQASTYPATDIARVVPAQVNSGIQVRKRLNTLGTLKPAHPLSFTITITNTGTTPITSLPLQDTYNTTYLAYDSVAGANPASDDNQDDGQIDWNNLVANTGSLAPGAVINVIVNFTARAATTSALGCDGATGFTCNTATVSGAVHASGTIQTASSNVNVAIRDEAKSSLGDYVWHDWNGDGVQNPAEPGINGVLLNLYVDLNQNNQIDSGEYISSTLTTNDVSNNPGFYQFTVVGDKTYIVEIAPENFDPGGPLEDFIFSNDKSIPPLNSSARRQVAPVGNPEARTDVDFALYCVFDLALTKTLATGQPAVISAGDDITFTITIYNQGVVPATNIQIVDYLPTGFTLSPRDTNGWVGAGLIATRTLPGTLAPNAATTLNIVLTAAPNLTAGDYVNAAEIASTTDEVGTVLPDIDSTPDTTNGNGNGGESSNLEDNQINENGKQPGQDEDDHDPAPFSVVSYSVGNQVFADLNNSAVRDANEQGIPGVTVILYDPNGTPADVSDDLEIARMDTGANGLYLFTNLPAGQYYVKIDEANFTSTGPLFGYTSSNEALDEDDPEDDADSVDNGIVMGTMIVSAIFTLGELNDPEPTGENPDNDPTTPDIRENLTIDFGFFLPNFDLALDKRIASGQPSSVQPGDAVNFRITVYNQGNMTAYTIGVKDYIPTGTSYTGSDVAGVAQTAGGNRVAITDNGGGDFTINTLNAGDRVTFIITLVVNPTYQGNTVRNWVEIAFADNDTIPTNTPPVDVDSTPDSVNFNQPGETDDLIDDNIINESGKQGGDEDDHDPSEINVGQIFDLALEKRIAAGQPSAVSPGAPVDFAITVYNQGTLDAYRIGVLDYIPAAMIYTGSNVASVTQTAGGNPIIITANGSGGFTIDTLKVGDSVSFNVTLTVSPTYQGTSIRNWAEIESADNDTDPNNAPPVDVDSTLDGTNFNTPGETDDLIDDNVIDENGKQGGDEDDHDPSEINVGQIFDLALTKSVAVGQPTAVSPGDAVNFTITVYNQGTLDAYRITVLDYVPAAMSYTGSNVDSVVQTASGNAVVITANGSGGFTINSLKAGDRVSFNVTLTVSPTYQGTSLRNWAEIERADNDTDPNNAPPVDVDSTPDGTNFNTPGETDDLDDDNIIDENGKQGGDEDDHDPSEINVGQIFDLALVKNVAPGQPSAVTPGAPVDFAITVYNQGTLDAYRIGVLDYIPAAMIYTGSNATSVTQTAGGNPIIIMADGSGGFTIDTLKVGDRVSFNVTLTVSPTYQGASLRNWAEIESADSDTDPNNAPPVDVDSTPDSVNFNQPGETDDMDDNNIIDENGKQGGDEDDHDGSEISVGQIFDLALDKKVAAGQPSAVVPGTPVDFTITVYNQSTLDAYTIGVKDYIPAALSYSGSNVGSVTQTAAGQAVAITANGSGGFTINSLKAGDRVSFNVTLTVSPTYQGTSIRNWAEIESADNDTDPNNAPPVDVDSTPDGTNFNTPGETDDLDDDNIIDENGKQGGDEDDHDPSEINVGQIFDLALDKKIAAGQPSAVSPGDPVNFTITVYNQGTQDAYRIGVKDYIPSSMSYTGSNATSVTQTAGGNAVTITAAGSGNFTIDTLKVGDRVSFNVTLTLSPTFQGTSLRNWAEISSADNDTNTTNTPPLDVDSTPDGTNFNTPGETNDLNDDNVINQNGKQGGDEDDHDPANLSVGQVFDLALRKLTSATTVQQGDEVLFTIEVINQGTINAYNVTVTDYVPTGFLFDANNSTNKTTGWTLVGGKPTLTIPGPLAASGGRTTVQIVLRVAPDFQGSSLQNIAEMSGADNDTNPNNTPPVDIDSVPDTSNTNDGTVKDNVINENWKDNPNANDQDDHDVAQVNVGQVFDLALEKTTSAAIVQPGDNVLFTLEVQNQGSLNAHNVQIIDYLPAGFLFDANHPTNRANGWALSNGQLATTIVGPIAASGGVKTVQLVLQVAPDFQGTRLQNVAEISKADNDTNPNNTPPVDVDSDPDANPNNDGIIKDGVTNENWKANPSTDDQDDHDPATINVGQIFDLALEKTTATTTVQPGDEVLFTVTIHNQGTLDAYNVQVTDYLPVGFRFDADAEVNKANGWSLVNGKPTTTIAGPIAANTTTSVQLLLHVASDFQGTRLQNVAEISKADNDTNPNNAPPIDVDSTPDTTNNNDGTVKDGVIDEDWKTNPTTDDQDDHDPASVNVGQVFDLALAKITSATTVQPGDNVPFTIRIINQGSLDAYNVEVSDYLPAGFLFDANNTTNLANGWSAAKDRVITIIAGPIAPGATVERELVLRVDPTFQGNTLTNIAEISQADNDTNPDNEPPADADSLPDGSSTNDGPAKDDVVDEDWKDDPVNNDQDDHDLAPVNVGQVFDLALRKTLAAGQPARIAVGDEVTFTITVLNQGSVDAYRVEVMEYLPTGFTLSPNDDNGWLASTNGRLLNTIATLPAGASTTLDIVLLVTLEAEGLTTQNGAEISRADNDTDPNNPPPVDVDSEPDANNDNDGVVKDDVVSEDYKANPPVNDQDDHDVAVIEVRELLSLGNRIWNDNGVGGGVVNNGIMDGDEVGIAGVVVNLLYADRTPVLDANGNPMQTTTDEEGYYLFEGLLPGDYVIHVDPSNFAPGGALEGLNNSDPTEAEPNQDGDINDNGINEGDPHTDGIYTGVIELTYREEPTGEPDSGNNGGGNSGDDNSNLTIDIGFFDPDITKVVVLESFTADLQDGVILIRWITSAEIDTFGFYLYLGEGGDFVNAYQLTGNMVRGQGAQGGIYEIEVPYAKDAYPDLDKIEIWLVEIEISGKRNHYGPVNVRTPQNSIFLPLISK